ncbi:hypothetical protein Fcan01_01335 [Folsomia candida]|uniref:Gustatory receptor n=1 Tax=Folsomia candida TaxID=158441 RepID=A0A226F4S5_FOLCA|nr:hypothetical protein Fcan01_01335 [Folsomia candida]
MSIIQHPSIERKIKVASKSSPKDEIQTPNNINFIQVFLNYGYYFLLTPFKINKHPVSAEYELGSNWTQKILCASAHSLLLLQSLSETRQQIFKGILLKNIHHPTNTFFAIATLANFSSKFLLIMIFWTREHSFLKIVQFLADNGHLSCIRFRSKLNSKRFLRFFCALLVTAAIINVAIFASTTEKLDPSPFSSDRIFRRIVATARYNFLLASDTRLNSVPTWDDIHPSDWIIGVLAFIGIWFRQLLAFTSDGFILLLAMFIWTLSQSFEQLVSRNCDKNEFLLNFQALKTVSNLIREIMGNCILLYFGEALFYYSVNINDLLKDEEDTERIRSLVFLSIAIMIFRFSGDSCQTVEDSVIGWIRLKFGEIDPGLTSVLMHDATKHVVGLHGSIFVVDYSTILSMVAAMVTYFVVCATSEGRRN